MIRRGRLAAFGLALTLGGCHQQATVVRQPASAGRELQLPSGITMAPARRIVALEEDRRYRWVEPDSLVSGLTSEDAASVRSRTVFDLRQTVETVIAANGWRPSPDSAEYDLAVFVVSRTEMVREARTEQTTTATTGLPRCDASTARRPGERCSNAPVNSRIYYVNVPTVVRRVFHVVRRRSDGATRVWVNPASNLPAVDAVVARDLLRLFTALDG